VADVPGTLYDKASNTLKGLDMKRIVLPIALALACGSAWAQDKPAAPKPKPQAPAAAPQAKEAAPADKATAAKKSRRTEDARACLEKGSNTEIIKCAEAYL
jgi:hypothetical protein